MKRETTRKDSVKAPVNPRLQVVRELLDHAEFIRRKGTTEAGAEASHLETLLKQRMQELEAKAA